MASDWKFTDWYAEHGDQLNKKRRSRYDTDPEYKKKVLAANRVSRAKHREENLKERAEERAAIKAKAPRPWKEVERTIDGKAGVVLVTIGALAKAINRSKIGIRLLEKKGVIPKPTIRNKQGERLYTPEMVEKIRSILKSKGRLSGRKTHSIPESIQCRIRLSDGSILDTPLFRVGALARAVDRSTITLEQMERRGVLPETPFRLPPNRRAYTADQIKAVHDTFAGYAGNLRGVSVKDVHAEIIKLWTDAKVVGAKFLEIISTDGGKSDDES